VEHQLHPLKNTNIHYSCLYSIRKDLKKFILCFSFNAFKGQCHKIFCFRFFHESVSPQPRICHFQKFAEIFASQSGSLLSTTRCQRHRCQRHWRQNCSRFQRHRQQISHRYKWHWRQILPPVLLVLLIPVASCHRYQRHRWQICHRYQ